MINLDTQQQSIVRSILHQHIPHATVWAFGSRVSGSARHTSDLDLTVISPIDTPALLTVREAFSESDLDIKIDIIRWHDLPLPLQQHIVNHHVIVQQTIL